MDASSSQVCAACERRCPGVSVLYLTFLPAHPQIWVSNPQSEPHFSRAAELLPPPRCAAWRSSHVLLSEALLLYLGCCYGSLPVT